MFRADCSPRNWFEETFSPDKYLSLIPWAPFSLYWPSKFTSDSGIQRSYAASVGTSRIIGSDAKNSSVSRATCFHSHLSKTRSYRSFVNSCTYIFHKQSIMCESKPPVDYQTWTYKLVQVLIPEMYQWVSISTCPISYLFFTDQSLPEKVSQILESRVNLEGASEAIAAQGISKCNHLGLVDPLDQVTELQLPWNHNLSATWIHHS